MIYKAKNLDGDWVYGYYVKYPDDLNVIHVKDKWESHTIDEKTLCRCLDEVDKNGNFIYVNDMINDFGGGLYVPDRENPDYNEKMAFPPTKLIGDSKRVGIIVEEDGTTRVMNKELNYSYNISKASKLSDLEVIGNIFD